MPERISRAIVGAMIGALAVVVRVEGQAPATPPDLSGFWVNQYTPDLSRALGRQPPFTSEGAERWRTVDTSHDPTGRC